MLIKVLTYILVCANIYLTNTKKVFAVTKKAYRMTWTVRPIGTTQKGGCYYIIADRPTKRKAVVIMLRIYLTNLGKYNEGELLGEWVELPVSQDELKEVFNRIGINEQYEEYFITDYECDFYEVGEYENLDTLNEIAEKLNELEEEESTVAKALMSECGYTLDEAIEKVNNGDYRIYSDCNDMTDVAYEVVEECGYLNNVPENVARYFDYEAFGRDLGIEGTFIFLDNGDCLEVIQ